MRYYLVVFITLIVHGNNVIAEETNFRDILRDVSPKASNYVLKNFYYLHASISTEGIQKIDQLAMECYKKDVVKRQELRNYLLAFISSNTSPAKVHQIREGFNCN